MKKEEIDSIVFGKYKDISKFGKAISYTGDLACVIGLAAGKLYAIGSYYNTSYITNSSVAIIKTGKETLAPIVVDIGGFVTNIKKIGINFKKYKGVFVYTK